MLPLAPGVALLATVPVILSLSRDHYGLMRVGALSACALPFLLPRTEPFFRAAAALLTWLFLVKTMQYTAGHEKPSGLADLLQFLTIPAVVRWEAPRRKDPRRMGQTLLRGLVQLGLALLLMLAVLQLDRTHPVQLITTQIGIYLSLAGACNLAVATLALRGLDYDDPFDSPLAARTPGEFWGRRWNTWVNHMLYRYVFVPSGGWRRPVRGTLAAFAVSGALHEGFVAVGTREFTGWMGGFFLAQGVLVAATSQSRSFRRLARHVPVLTWAFTLVVLLATGVMLVRGADGIDPSDAWHRCCR
jgi:hypothetical protein